MCVLFILVKNHREFSWVWKNASSWTVNITYAFTVCIYDRIKRINWPQQHSCIYVNSCVNSVVVRFFYIYVCLQFSFLGSCFTFKQWLSVIFVRYKTNRFGQFKKWLNAAIKRNDSSSFWMMFLNHERIDSEMNNWKKFDWIIWSKISKFPTNKKNI